MTTQESAMRPDDPFFLLAIACAERSISVIRNPRAMESLEAAKAWRDDPSPKNKERCRLAAITANYASVVLSEKATAADYAAHSVFAGNPRYYAEWAAHVALDYEAQQAIEALAQSQLPTP